MLVFITKLFQIKENRVFFVNVYKLWLALKNNLTYILEVLKSDNMVGVWANGTYILAAATLKIS